MDILTHAMAGAVLASPLLPAAPLTASCFVLGSALPDLDALSRLGGKVAFLRWHQTYTHSIPVICAATALAWPLPGWLGLDEPWAAAALGLAMLLHTLMDATNTYGTALLAPICRQRFCTEWIFLVDGIVVTATAGCLAMVLVNLYRGRPGGWAVGLGYASFLVVYWSLRWLLHGRALRLAPLGTRSLVPSAFVPWQFYGFSADGAVARVFQLSAIRGATSNHASWPMLDCRYEAWLGRVVEYRIMRELSPGYCTVEVRQDEGKTTLVCRDLRIRNFGGKFGRLELTFDCDGQLVRKVFDV